DAARGRGAPRRDRRGALGRDRAGRCVDDRPDHARRPREAPRGRLRAARTARGRRPEPRPAAVEGVPVPLLRLRRHAAREHLRADAVPLDPLLRALPPAVRAVQDAVAGPSGTSTRSRSPISRMTRAGTPPATTPAGRSRATTPPAPTTVSSPIVTPGQTITPPPSQTLSPRTIGAPDSQPARRGNGSTGCVAVSSCTRVAIWQAHPIVIGATSSMRQS